MTTNTTTATGPADAGSIRTAAAIILGLWRCRHDRWALGRIRMAVEAVGETRESRA